MTQEEKAKAYDEALENAKLILDMTSDKSAIYTIFPELKESEDEKIRKALVDYFDDANKTDENPLQSYGIHTDKVIAWLEKQKEKNFIDKNLVKEEAHRIAWEYSKHYDPLLSKESWCEMAALDMADWLEKQGEQKPNPCDGCINRKGCINCENGELRETEHKPVDKVEPKFHEGDWCIDNEDGTIFQIVKVLDNTYTYKTNEDKEYSCTHYSLENDARLWTIQDAKDGDVLVDRYGNISIFEKTFGFDWHSYCYLGCNGDFMYNEVGGSHDLVDTYPATKEQRDLLFQKMKEAGYEWSSEHRKLIKRE